MSDDYEDDDDGLHARTRRGVVRDRTQQDSPRSLVRRVAWVVGMLAVFLLCIVTAASLIGDPQPVDSVPAEVRRNPDPATVTAAQDQIDPRVTADQPLIGRGTPPYRTGARAPDPPSTPAVSTPDNPAARAHGLRPEMLPSGERVYRADAVDRVFTGLENDLKQADAGERAAVGSRISAGAEPTEADEPRQDAPAARQEAPRSQVAFSRRPASAWRGSQPDAPTTASGPPPADPSRYVENELMTRMGFPPVPVQPPPAQPVPETDSPQQAARRSTVPRDTHTTPKPGTHRLFEGKTLAATLAIQLDGSGANSPVIAGLREDIRTEDGTLVIPKGALAVGTAGQVTGQGQTRLAITFHRVRWPASGSRAAGDVSLDQFVSLNLAGDAGIRGKVNNHYLRLFGVSAAVGLITGLTQGLSSGQLGRDGGVSVTLGSGAEGATQAMANVFNRLTNILPTVTVPQNTPVLIWLADDLDLPAVQEMR